MSDEVVSFEISKDLREQIKKATDEAVIAALEAVGVQAASFAAAEATTKGVIDTGLLANSLTFALAGKPAEKGEYSGDRASKYGGKEIPSGRYEGAAPADKPGERVVYVGTNVEYAIYQELGWQSKNKKHPARPFLRPAIEKHSSDYEKIITGVLSKLGK